MLVPVDPQTTRLSLYASRYLRPVLYVGVFLFFGFIFFGSANVKQAHAVDSNCIAAGAGNWTTITWTNCTGNAGGDPDSDDTVTIPDTGIAVTLDTSTTIGALVMCDTACATPGSLTHNTTNSLNINGAVTMHGGSGANDTSRWNINAGSATVTGLITFNGQSTTSGRDAQIVVTTGSLTANGGVDFEDVAGQQITQIISYTSGTVTIGGSFAHDCGTISNATTAGTLIFTGTYTFGSATCNPVLTTISGTLVKHANSITANNSDTLTYNSASTAEFTATASITPTAAITFGNLTTSGSGTITTAGNIAVAGNLTIGNGTTFTQGNTFTLTVTGNTTVGGGTSGILSCNATAGTRTLNGNLTISAGATYNKTNCGTLTFSKGAAQTITDNTSGQDLGTVTTATTSTSVSTSTGIRLTALTIAASTTWNISDDAMVITGGGGGGTALTVTGTFTTNSSSTVEYTATGPLITNTTYGGLKISGSVTASTSATVTGNFNVTGTFTPSAGTITLNNGASISNSGTLTFKALTVANSAATTTSDSFSIDGAFTIGTSATFTASAGTITRNGTAWTTSNSGTITYYNLTWAGDPATEPSSSFTVSSVFTINTGITVQPTAGTITLSGSGTPFVASGTALFNPLGGTVIYNGTSATTVSLTPNNPTYGVAYQNLILSPAATVNYTIGDAVGETLFVNGDFTIGNGTDAVTVKCDTYNPGLDMRGNFLIKASANFTKNTAGIVFQKSGTQTITDENSGSPRDIGDLILGGGTTTVLGSDIKVTTVNITTGQVLDLGSNYNLTVTGTSWTNADGASAFLERSGTVTFSGSIAVPAETFYNLTVAGTGVVTTSANITVAGALTVNTSGSFIASAGTITFTGGSISNSATLTFYNLTISGSVSTASNFTVASVLTVSTGITFQPTGNVTLSGSGTPLVLSGTGVYQPLGGATIYTSTSATTITAAPTEGTVNVLYWDLTLAPAGTVTYTLGSSGYTRVYVWGALTIGNGTNVVTVDADAFDVVTEVRLSLTIQNNARYTAGGSSFWLSNRDGVSGTVTVTNNNSTANDSIGSVLISGDGVTTVNLGSNLKVESVEIQTNDILDVTTNNYTLTVNNLWTNSSGSTSGFNARSGTVVFATASTATINGATNFHNVSVTGIGAAKILTFQASTIFTFGGTFTVTGASGQLVTLQSSSAGTQWKAHFNSAQSSVTYASIKDSGCDTGTAAVTLDTTSANVSGNDTSCWSFSVSSITISGTLYTSAENVTVNTNGTSVLMAVGGSTQYTTTTTGSNGTWSFTNVTAPSAGAIITIWMNVGSTAGTTDASLVFRYGSSCTSYPNCTGLSLYQTKVILDSLDGSDLTVADLAACDNDSGTACTDTDIGFTSNAGTMTGMWSTRVLRMKDSTAKFAPGGTLTFGGTIVQSAGTFTGSTMTVTTGTYTLSGGTLNVGTGTLTFSGNLTTSGGTVNGSSGTLRVSSGTFTVSGATINGDTGNIDINSGSFNMSSGVFTMGSGGMQIELSFTLSGGTFNNSYIITFNDASSSAAQDSTITCTGTLAGTVVISKLDIVGTVGSGTSDVTIAEGCSVSFGSDPTTAAGQITNNGTITVSGTGVWALTFAPGGNLINSSTGTVTQNGTGGWTFTDGGLSNSGAITYAGTTMTVERDFTQSGTFNLTGKTVTFTNSIADSTTVTCSGTLGGTVVFNKTAGAGTSATVVAAGCSINLGTGPTTTIESGLTNNGTIVIDGGTWTYVGIETTPTLTNNGTITHNGSGWDINEASLTNNGTITYSGTTITIEEGFTQAGTFNLSGKTITFDTDTGSDATTIACTGSLGGTVVIDKSGSVSGVSSVTIGSGCTVDLGTNATVNLSSNGASSFLTINGTLTASGNTSFTIKTSAANPSTATPVTVSSGGTLSYTGTGTWAFTDTSLTVSSGGTATFSGTSLTFDRNFTQSGTFDLTGIIVSIIDGTSSVDTSIVTCTGSLGGTIAFARSGSSNSPITIAAGCSVTLESTSSTSTLGLGGGITVAGTLIIPSGVTWTVNVNGVNSTASNITVNSGGTITHNGSGWAINDGGLIINSGGTVTYSGTTLSMDRSFTNSGTFDSTGKTITLGGTSSSDTATLTCGSTIGGNLILNKTSTNATTIGSDCTISGDFTRTDGSIGNPSSAFILHIGGNFSTSTTDALGGANLTIDFTGSTAQTITQNATPSTNTTLFTINKTNNSDTVTLASNLVLGSTLTITKGVFDQGATFNLTTGGALSVGANGTWQNTGTGDVTLAGNVSNSGVINLDGSGVGCGGADAIAITSSAAAQRVWSGAGTFTLYDLTVTWMGGTMTTYSSTNSGTGTSDLGSGAWTFTANCPSVAVTISGTIYQNDGTTVYNCSSNNLSIVIKVNGAGSYSGTCSAVGGTYSVASVTVSATNDVITVFLDEETENAVTVTKAKDDSTNITDLNLYENRVTIRTETGASAMTNANLNQYDSGCSAGTGDSDVQFCSDGTNLTVSDGSMLLIFDNATTTTAFTPGGTVTTDPSSSGTDSVVDGDLTIQSGATLTMGTNALSIGGDFNNAGTLSVTSAQTTTFTATSTGFTMDKSGSGNMDAVTFNGTGGEWTYNYSASPTGDITVTDGTLKIGSTTLTVAASKTLSIGASGVLDGGSGTVVLAGTGTPFSITGTFTPNTGTIQYTAATANVTATTYKNLTLGGTGTYTLPASNITMRGNLVVTTGASVTKSASNKIIFAIGGGSSQTLTGNANNSDLGIIQVSANSGVTTLNLGSSIKVTSLLVDTSQIFSSNGSNTLTITGTGATTSRPFINDGTFTQSTGTVEYIGDGDTDIETTNVTYNNLTADPSITAARVYTPNGALTVSGTLNINPTAASTTKNLAFNLGGTTSIGTLTITGTGTGTSSLSTNGANHSLSAGSISIASAGTLTANDSTVTLTGSSNPFTVNGTFNPGGSTVVYSSTSATNIENTTYNHLSLTPAGTVSYTLDAGTFNIKNLTIGNGTNILTVRADSNNPTINITGDLLIAANAVYTKGSGTTTFKKGASQTWTDNTSGQDLGAVAVSINSTNTTLNLGSSVKAASMTVDNDQSLVLGSNTLELTGTGTPLSLGTSVTFTVTGSTLKYSGTTATVTATTLNNLTLGGTGTYTMPGSNLTLRGNLSIPSGATITKGAGTVIFAKGDTQTWTDSNGTAQDIGAVQISSNSTNTTLQTGSDVKATSITIDTDQIFDLAGGSRTLTLTSNSSPLTLNGTFTDTDDTIVFAPGSAGTVSIPTRTYYVMTVNGSGSTFRPASGTLNIGTLNITAGSLDLDTNDPTATISGTLTITGTLLASASNPLTINSAFTNNGTFTHNNGTVVLTPTASSLTIGGSANTHSFYNLTSTTPGKTILIESDDTLAVSGALTLTGSSGNLIELDSTSGTWNITFTGTESINFIGVKN
jgi:hypothetical protein